MSSLTIPIILTLAAIIVAISAYRGIRRGASRFYTLERESMLRRAGFTLIGSIVLFLGAIGLLAYGEWQDQNISETPAGEVDFLEAMEESDPFLQTQPPTQTPSPTVDPNLPTPAPTPVVCRAIVDGTAGSGLTLRDAPSGAEVSILPDGSILTLEDEEPVEVNTFIWRKVRSPALEEGWVVEEFLKMGACQQ
jgi:hypothetical protein